MKRLRIMTKQQTNNFFAGLYRSYFRGPGMDFQEVREYESSDDFRHIDWNVTSRMNALYTKVFSEERDLTLMLLTDVSASITAGPGLERKRRLLTIVYSLLAYAASINNDRVGAVHFSDVIEKFIFPRKGTRHVLGMMYDILLCPFSGSGSNLDLALTAVLKYMRKRGICVILSDFRINPDPALLSLLCKKHTVTAIVLWDEDENRFPVNGMLVTGDPENGPWRRSFGASKQYRKEYHKFWEGARTRTIHSLRMKGIGVLSLKTGEDPFYKLKGFFSRGKSWEE